MNHHRASHEYGEREHRGGGGSQRESRGGGMQGGQGERRFSSPRDDWPDPTHDYQSGRFGGDYESGGERAYSHGYGERDDYGERGGYGEDVRGSYRDEQRGTRGRAGSSGRDDESRGYRHGYESGAQRQGARDRIESGYPYGYGTHGPGDDRSSSYGEERGGYGTAGGYAGSRGGYASMEQGGYGRSQRDFGGGMDTSYGGSRGGYGGMQGGHGARGGYGDPGRGFTESIGYMYGDGGHERGAMQGGHRGAGPRNYTRSDERIREDLNERLYDDDMVDASGITVDVDDGVVKLEGSVDQRWIKHRVEDMAEAVSGVKDVENRLRVRSGAESGDASSASRSAMSASGGTQGASSSAQSGGTRSATSSRSSSQRST